MNDLKCKSALHCKRHNRNADLRKFLVTEQNSDYNNNRMSMVCKLKIERLF